MRSNVHECTKHYNHELRTQNEHDNFIELRTEVYYSQELLYITVKS